MKRRGGRTEYSYHAGEKRIAVETFESGRMVKREGLIPDGPVIGCYPDGKIKRTACYKNQRLHGQCLAYYCSGELLERQHFSNGILDGPCIRYRKDGTVWIESSYRSGKLHGVFRSYHDNGQMEAAGRYQKVADFTSVTTGLAV